MQVDFLGTLTFNEELSLWEGKARWLEEMVPISIEPDPDELLENPLTTAKGLWGNAQEWNQLVRLFATKELLPLKNETWLEEDEALVTAAQFQERIQLDGIFCFEEGAFEFWFRDGDLFWGHYIVISGDLASGCTDAAIMG